MSLLSKTQNKDFFIFKILLFIIFSLLIYFRLHSKTFFDDEIATIGIINERDIFSIYSYVNHWDVSPPLSYILIYIGEKIFGFQYAPLLFLPLQIYCLNSFIKLTSKIFFKNNEIKFYYLICIILNPIFILWCTSLRWYSLWVPLALYIIGKIFFQKHRDFKEIFLILISLTLMFHLNYLTIIFIFCLYFSNFKQINKEFFNFIKNKIFLFLLIFFINIPQIYFFLSNHLMNSSSQYGDYFFSFLYPAITIVFGNSVFPLEIISILFFFILILILFKNIDIFKKKIFKTFKNLIIFFSLFFIIIFLFKLGHKPRHSIILNYIFIIYFFINLIFLKNLTLKRLSIVIFIIFTFFGINNTIKEENLIKNNINLPIKKILVFLKNEKNECKIKYIFTHNLNIKFYIKNNNNYVINSKVLKKNNYNCTFIIKTFIANDNQNDVNLVNQHFTKAKSSLKLKNFEYDKFSAIKEKIFKNKIKNNFIVEILY